MRSTALAWGAVAAVTAGVVVWLAASGARGVAHPQGADDRSQELSQLRADVDRHEGELARLRSDLDRRARLETPPRVARETAPAPAPAPGPARSSDADATPPGGAADRSSKQALDRLKSVTDGRRFVAVEDARTDLVRMGDEAVPDVLALLDSGFEQDWGGRFETRGFHVDGYPGARMVLLDVLRQIGTPTSKKAFAEALGRSEHVGDLWALKLYWGATDPVIVDAIAQVAPRLLGLVAKTGLPTAVGDRPDSPVDNLLLWLFMHPTPGLAGPLEEIVLAGRPAGSWNERAFESAFSLLVLDAPEKAAEDVLALHGREPDKRDLFELSGKLSCANALRARYFATLFARGEFTTQVRLELYQRMPAGLWADPWMGRNAPDRAAQLADARPYVDFLERRLEAETDPNAKRVLEGALSRMRAQIAASPK